MPLKILSEHRNHAEKTFVKTINKYSLQKEFKKIKNPQLNEAKIQLTDCSVFLKYRSIAQDNSLHRNLINFKHIQKHR